MDRQARLAADIGGTFTDVVLDAPAGRFTIKTLTASSAPERGVAEGGRTAWTTSVGEASNPATKPKSSRSSG